MPQGSALRPVFFSQYTLAIGAICRCHGVSYHTEGAKLQRVQNSAARLITCTPRCEHITPMLKQLHWLPLTQSLTHRADISCNPRISPRVLV